MRRWVVPMGALICLAAVVLVANWLFDWSGPGLPPAAQVHAGGPITPEEQAVAEWIIKYHSNPSSVQWVEWGPSDPGLGLTHYKDDPQQEKYIRVRYHSRDKDQPERILDGVFRLDKENKVIIGEGNPCGRGWLRRAMARKQAIVDAWRRQ